MPPSIATPLSSLTARELYGVRALPPAGVVPFGYTGHAEDPTGLTWGRARCYAPRTGGWTGEDPVFTEPRYAYVGGRPSWGTDPTGRVAAVEYACTLVFGAAVGFVIGTAAGASIDWAFGRLNPDFDWVHNNGAQSAAIAGACAATAARGTGGGGSTPPPAPPLRPRPTISMPPPPPLPYRPTISMPPPPPPPWAVWM